jgi:ABC-type bacteriocin/lantibiotic exporter with double-glycine peptidase domain
LKASGSESDFYTRWAGFQAKFVNAKQNQTWLNILTATVPTLCTGLSAALVLGGGALLIINGDLTIGGLVAFGLLASQFNEPINGLVQFGSSLQQIAVEIQRLDDVHKYNVDTKYQRPKYIAVEKLNHKKLYGKVELKNITFGYSRLEAPIIENFNLTLTPGTRVALVGPSGSGKSTIAKLISGLYSPWEGEILFDGVPLQEIPASILASSLAMVEQEPFFFKGSIRENITMWDSSIHEDAITPAAKKAEIYEEIAGRPGAFEGEIYEAGTNFSGGQLQRLEITRALLSEPSILIMDEGTSALDPILEERIDNSMRSFGITSLIIAHRLSTIRDCEEIVVLEKGKVVERGNHEELVQNNGFYMKLINSEK